MNFWARIWLNDVCDSIYAMCFVLMCEICAQNENKCRRRLLARYWSCARALHFSAAPGASAARCAKSGDEHAANQILARRVLGA